jgi:hypothetical protein
MKGDLLIQTKKCFVEINKHVESKKPLIMRMNSCITLFGICSFIILVNYSSLLKYKYREK